MFLATVITPYIKRSADRHRFEWICFGEGNPVSEHQICVSMNFCVFADHDPAVGGILPTSHGLTPKHWESTAGPVFCKAARSFKKLTLISTLPK
jgi:hypothetical protein